MTTAELDACDQFNALKDAGEVFYVSKGLPFADYQIADRAMAERMVKEWPGGGVRVFSQAEVDQWRKEMAAKVGAP